MNECSYVLLIMYTLNMHVYAMAYTVYFAQFFRTRLTLKGLSLLMFSLYFMCDEMLWVGLYR